MVLIYTFSSNENPKILSQLFWQNQVGHRIVQQEHGEQLWLLDPANFDLASELISLYQQGPEAIAKSTPKTNKSFNVWLLITRYPITLFLILTSLLLALLTELGQNIQMASWFFFTPVYAFQNTLYAVPLSAALEQHQYWRLITPIFLHFSILHISFNLLWMWDIGRKIERNIGSFLYFVGVAITGIASNYLQFYTMQSPLFGGMSGVVYGVIAFAWLLPKLLPNKPIFVSQPIMIFLIVWLLLGYTNLMDSVGLGKIANTAHLVGLVAGLILATFYAAIAKLTSKSSNY